MCVATSELAGSVYKNSDEDLRPITALNRSQCQSTIFVL